MDIETTYGEEKPTYFVIREGGPARLAGNNPRKRHHSRYNAEREAERLAKENPGVDFHTVKLKKTVKASVESPAEIVERIDEHDTGVRSSYPSDGGLKEAVRPLGSGPSLFERMVGKARVPRCADLVTYMERGVERQGEIKQVVHRFGQKDGYIIRDIVDNTIMRRTYDAGDFRVDTKAEDRPEAAKACADETGKFGIGDVLGAIAAAAMMSAATKKSAKFENGEDVIVIVQASSIFAEGSRAKFLRSDDSDPTRAWVKLVDEDGQDEVLVSLSRVFRVDDPRFIQIA